ncbi:MAG TPA: hypothetical protein VGV64_04440, partial [Thermoplasmata archaeon]|nr:hypothetical protein [Thermoplasmata archaeon]
VFAPVRVRWSHGTVDVASELVRSLDPEFEGRGFPIVEILAGFLRRLERSRRPAVVVLDDLGPDVPDIGPVVRALRSPIRFLPEGIDDPPRVWLLLAGRSEPSYCWQRADRAGAPIERTVLLPPYTDREIREIVGDRARRALGREAPPGTVERIVDRAIDGGLGLPKAIDLLRQAILGPERLRPGSPYRPPSARSAALVEPRLLLALRKATERGPAELRQLRAWEAKFAQEAGLRPLPTTTLWRRIVRLEAAGIVRRSVRTGGNGGTRSSLELVRPIGPSEMITALPDNPRAVETAGPIAPA